jgi:hypothetical protein
VPVSMNLRRALDTIADDPQVTAKIEVGVVALTMPLVGFAAVGYQVALARRVAAGLDRGLPAWDDPAALVTTGIRLAVARNLYELPARLLLVGTLVLALRPLWLARSAGVPWTVPAREAVQILAAGLLAVLVYNVAYGLLSPGITALYAQRGTLCACFDLPALLRLAWRQPRAYLQVWALRESMGLAVRLAGFGVGLVAGLLPLVGPLAANLSWGWLLFVSLLLNGCLVGQLLQGEQRAARPRLHPPAPALPAPERPDPHSH